MPPEAGDFAGKVALVTGAASGVGRASAELLAARGAAVACLDRRGEDVEALAEGIFTAGGEAGFSPKAAKELADALRSAAMAQGISTNRRQKVDKEFKAGVEKAVDTVARTKGMSAETAEAIKSQILGVKAG